MLPKDPLLHAVYRQKLRDGRRRQQERQWAPIPIGTKFTDEHRANLSAAFQSSSKHRSKNQSGQNNSMYKGGSYDKHGYVLIPIDGKQIPEHRFVMEQMIGRPLSSEETVHHKNGIRDDNRPENLELWSGRQPKGQRVEDKLAHAQSLLSEYGVVLNCFSATDVAAGMMLG